MWRSILGFVGHFLLQAGRHPCSPIGAGPSQVRLSLQVGPNQGLKCYLGLVNQPEAWVYSVSQELRLVSVQEGVDVIMVEHSTLLNPSFFIRHLGSSTPPSPTAIYALSLGTHSFIDNDQRQTDPRDREKLLVGVHVMFQGRE